MDSPQLKNSYLPVPSFTIYKNFTMANIKSFSWVGGPASSSQDHSQHKVTIHITLLAAEI